MNTRKFLMLAALTFFSCSDDEYSSPNLHKVQYFFSTHLFQEETFYYEHGRLSRIVLTDIDQNTEEKRSDFSYSQNETSVKVNGGLGFRHLLFDKGRLVRYVLRKEGREPGDFYQDTLTFEYESEKLKMIRLNKIGYSVHLDDRGNISQLGEMNYMLEFDDKPNPFRGIPDELIVFGSSYTDISYRNILRYFNRNNAVNNGIHYTYEHDRVVKMESIAAGIYFTDKINYRIF